MPGAWPQPNNGAGQQPNLRWVQPKAPETKDGNNNNTAQKQATNVNTQPATIDPYSGWYWDGTQWQYGIVGVSKQAMDTNNTNGQSNGSGDNSNDASNNGWDDNNDTSGTNNNDTSWDNANDATGTNNNDTSWDNANDNKDTNNNDTSWDNDDKKSTSGNGGTDWNNNADTSGAASTGNNDWGTPAPADNTVHTLNPSNNSNNNFNNDNVSASTPAGNYKGPPLHGPHGAYHGPKLAVAAPSNWVIDEPAPYDVPASFAASRSLSKQVQRGRAYNYFKRHRKPIYIDSIAEPYARFVFKYRTKENLPKGLKVEAGEEPNPEQGLQDLQDKGREELIEELRRFRKVYGEQAPEVDVGKHEGGAGEEENDAMEWNATPPEKSFLDYSLPVYFGDDGGGGTSGTSNANGNGNGSVKGDGKTNGDGGGNKADDGWANTTADANAGGTSWETNTGGGGGGAIPSAGW
jgi:hypothetical protein